MPPSYEQTARLEYERAWRLGQRDYAARVARGERGNVPVLDELTEQAHIMAYMKQPQREISLARVVGTYTSARAYSFSGNFMPLHPDGTEFASKWIALCASHMEEGLRDPIEVYEYLWNYYVVEGNKRVSVLKYFGAPSVRADITRLIPQLDANSPQTAAYYAYLRYDRNGLFKNVRLSSAQRYERLAQIESDLLKKEDGRATPNVYNSMILRFGEAYAQTRSILPMGDAFLEYLQLYGFLTDTAMGTLVERINQMQPQLDLAASAQAEPTLLLDSREAAAPFRLGRLFSQRKAARVLFVYGEGRTATNWIGAHEKGRLAMQQELGEQVETSYLDGLTADTVYDALAAQTKVPDLLLITSTSLALPALRYALEHPESLTLAYSRVRPDYRLNTYYGRYYEPVFLCGVAAGLASAKRSVAYITPNVGSLRHTADINAFALGVRSVAPQTNVLLVWNQVRPEDPRTCEAGIRQAVEHGCDVALVPDYPGLALPGLPEGAFSLLLRLHEMGLPSQYLASPAWDWGRFYTEIVKSYLNGSLDMLRFIARGDPTVTGLWWGLGTGVLTFESTDFLPPGANNLLQYLRSSIELGRFAPFRGPIYDREGNLRIAARSDPKPFDILSMDWIVDFVQVV